MIAIPILHLVGILLLAAFFGGAVGFVSALK